MSRRRFRTRLGRLALGLLDAGVAGTITAGLAARYVRPDVAWWPQLAAMGLPAAAVAAVPLAAIWARRARGGSSWAWAGCALHVGLVLLVVARYGPPWASPSPADSERTLRVLLLNAGVPGASAGPGMHAELASSPDLVALQESNLFRVEAASGETAVAGTPAALAVVFGGFAAPDGSLDADGFRQRMPVFVPDSLVSFEEIEIDPEGDDLSGLAVRAVVRWQGLDVAVYNVHLRSFGPERPWTSDRPWSRSSVRGAATNFRDTVVKRAAEAERLRRRVDAETLPYLIVGDFNSTPQQWVYRHLAESHAEVLRRAGWRRATYPSRLPVVAIDHVLGGPGWEAAGARIGRDDISDHRPVHGWLRWTGALPDSAASE